MPGTGDNDSDQPLSRRTGGARQEKPRQQHQRGTARSSAERQWQLFPDPRTLSPTAAGPSHRPRHKKRPPRRLPGPATAPLPPFPGTRQPRQLGRRSAPYPPVPHLVMRGLQDTATASSLPQKSVWLNCTNRACTSGLGSSSSHASSTTDSGRGDERRGENSGRFAAAAATAAVSAAALSCSSHSCCSLRANKKSSSPISSTAAPVGRQSHNRDP